MSRLSTMELSHKQENWFELRSFHLVQIRAVSYLEALTTPEGEKVSVTANALTPMTPIPNEYSEPSTLKILLVTTCRGTAVVTVTNTKPPSEVWRLLEQD